MAPFQQSKEDAMNALDTQMQTELSSWEKVRLNARWNFQLGVTWFNLVATLLMVISIILSGPGLFNLSGLIFNLAILGWKMMGGSRLDQDPSPVVKEAYLKMRELGLQGSQHPVYFWEGRKIPSVQGERLMLEVKCLQPLPRGRDLVRKYQIRSAEGEAVRVVEDGPEGPVFKLGTVHRQLLPPVLTDPELAESLSSEEDEALVRMQDWVRQLNRRAEGELDESEARLLDTRSAADRKLDRMHQIRHRSMRD